MTEQELPSEDELFNGRATDGSRPAMPSGRLYEKWGKPIPGGDENKTHDEVERDRLHYQIDRQHLARLDKCCRFAEAMVDVGLDAIANAPPEAVAEAVAETQSANGRPPYSGDKRPRTVGAAVLPDDPRERDEISTAQCEAAADQLAAALEAAGDAAPTPKLSSQTRAIPLEKAILIGERGSKLLMTASAKRTEIAHRLVNTALTLDTRRSFLQNRSVAVVYATLLHLDETFREIGFGSWMPFRYPDQWLSFCGVMQRVLAANGLIHSDNPEVYRKLLDETPPVKIPGTIDERVKQAQTPEHLGLCARNRGPRTFDELARILKSQPPPQ
ncbi:MAG: hypothetical protein H6839_10410 [Planctomycetes bacterium]|nr:hypothetical protein [Planctomycetota bacterium]